MLLSQEHVGAQPCPERVADTKNRCLGLKQKCMSCPIAPPAIKCSLYSHTHELMHTSTQTRTHAVAMASSWRCFQNMPEWNYQKPMPINASCVSNYLACIIRHREIVNQKADRHRPFGDQKWSSKNTSALIPCLRSLRDKAWDLSFQTVTMRLIFPTLFFGWTHLCVCVCDHFLAHNGAAVDFGCLAFLLAAS